MQNQILLEKVGESKSQKLLNECNNIYMEQFHKEYPDYFEHNFLKSICKILVTEKDSNEIKGIGMSCMNDLMTKQFAQWFGGFLGANASTSGDTMKRLGGTQFNVGNSHGGSNFSHWGNNNSGGSRGITITVGNGVTIPTKDDFNNPSGGILGLIVNAGSFNSGLGTVDWTAGGTATSDFVISNIFVDGIWSLSGQGSANYLILSDLINPTVPAFIGQSVFIDYTFVFQ